MPNHCVMSGNSSSSSRSGSESNRICFYHKGCSDGIAASWCFQRKYPNSQLIPIYPQDKRIDLNKIDVKGKKVYFVDVCAAQEILLKIIKKAKQVTILDHHDAYEELLESLRTQLKRKKQLNKLSLTFDKTKAACQIVWDKYFKKKKRPLFIDYIADRDLWQFKLPHSKGVNNALYHMGKINHKSLTELDRLSNEEFKDMIKNELVPFAKIKQQLDDNALFFGERGARACTMDTGTNKYVGWIAQIQPALKSELGNVLAKKSLPNGDQPDFAVIYQYSFEQKEWWLSFRGNGKQNMSEICKEVDPAAGGHPNAAGLTLKDCRQDGTHLNDLFKSL